MENLLIILVIMIVGLVLFVPIYYTHKKKNLEKRLKEGKQVSEREKIRVYIDNINNKFRAKHK